MISFKQKNKGFTLVEMLISVGIFTVMSGIILANYPEFRSRSALDGLASEVALVFRQAQIYGISVRRDSAQSFKGVYGVHVTLKVDKKIVIFSDIDSNYVYSPQSDIVVEEFTLNGGAKISALCSNPEVFSRQGMSCKGNEIDTSITVFFERPNPDAIFTINSELADAPVSNVALDISNRSGSYKRSIQIFTTGQISVR